MKCMSCGTTLAASAAKCPACGASTPNTLYTDEMPYMQFGEFTEASASFPVAQTNQALQPNLYSISSQAVQLEQEGQRNKTNGLPMQPHYISTQVPSHSYGYAPPAVSTLPVQTKPQKRRNPTGALVALVVLIGMLVIGGSGFLYYTTVFHPAELHAQATTVAKTVLTAQVKSTATAYANSPEGIYTLATRGAPVIDNPLDGQIISDWQEYHSTIFKGACLYKSGAYHVTLTRNNTLYYCTAGNIFENFAMQVQMTIIDGFSAGIVFRTNAYTGRFYRFTLSVDGFENLYVYSGSDIKPLQKTYSSFIHVGHNQANLLTAIALGSNIYLYVNKHFLVRVTDNTYSNGKVGFIVDDYTQPADVAFSHAQVWSL